MYQVIWSLIRRATPAGSGPGPIFNLRPGRLMLLLAAVLSLPAWACAGSAGPNPTPTAAEALNPSPAMASRIIVVTTTTVLADMARNVGDGLVQVSPIVPPGADVHSFQTTPSDSVNIGRAKVIVSNGFGLDQFLDPVLASAQQAGAVHVIAAAGLNAVPLEETPFPGADPGDGPGQEDADEHLAGDPHFWLDPILAIHYVEQIRDGLSQADPANSGIYAANAEGYIQELRDLDREIQQTLSQVPPEHRRLISFHDAYGYFARRYGWEVSFFEPSDASDVTPGAVEKIIREIQSEGIPAIFAEPQFNQDVLQQVARDTGIKVGVIHSLSDSTTPTYIGLMTANANSLAENLK